MKCVRFMPPLPAIRNLRPTNGIASNTSTRAPPAASASAAISPAGPSPTIATLTGFPSVDMFFRNEKKERHFRIGARIGPSRTLQRAINSEKAFGRRRASKYDPAIHCSINYYNYVHYPRARPCFRPGRYHRFAPVIRNAADVSNLVNRDAAVGGNARVVVAIALGGVFLDAYDLGTLAFSVKDIAREFPLSPAGKGSVASAITFGAIIGGYFTNKVGPDTACSWPTCSFS